MEMHSFITLKFYGNSEKTFVYGFTKLQSFYSIGVWGRACVIKNYSVLWSYDLSMCVCVCMCVFVCVCVRERERESESERETEYV